MSYNYVHRILAEFLSLTGPAGAADIAQARPLAPPAAPGSGVLLARERGGAPNPDLTAPLPPALSSHAAVRPPQSVTGPALLRMIHTTDGVRAASALLGAATAKERKALLKAVKVRRRQHPPDTNTSLPHHPPGTSSSGEATHDSVGAPPLPASISPHQGRVLDIAKDECGHVVLLAALECVDDTQLLSKAILSAHPPFRPVAPHAPPPPPPCFRQL